MMLTAWMINYLKGIWERSGTTPPAVEPPPPMPPGDGWMQWVSWSQDVDRPRNHDLVLIWRNGWKHACEADPHTFPDEYSDAGLYWKPVQ